MKNIDLLHHRLGHQAEESIKEGLKRSAWIGVGMDPEQTRKENLSYCPDCFKGKMKSLPLRYSDTDYSNLGPLSTDSKGPFRISSKEGHYKYFDLFVFRSSHYMMVRFKKSKDEVYGNIQEILNEVKRLGEYVTHIQTDDDSS